MLKQFIQFNFNKFAREVLLKSGRILEMKAKSNLKLKSNGRKYKIKGKMHTASKPYNSPNNFTKALSSSVGSGLNNNTLIFGGGNPRVNYAKFLELGTNKIEPRPLFHLSFFQVRKTIDSFIDDGIANNFRVKQGTSSFESYKKQTTQPQRTLYFGIPNFNFKQKGKRLEH